MLRQGKQVFRMVSLMVLPWLVACGSVPLPIGDVYTSSHCYITKEGVTPIVNEKELRDVIKKSQSGVVGAMSPAIPEVNFETSMAYVISMGSKPTAGYAIQLTEKEACYKDGVVGLPVKLVEPGQKMAAQIVTSPCKVITLPRGDYERVEMQ